MESLFNQITKFLTIKIFGVYKVNLAKIFNKCNLGYYEGHLIFQEIHNLLLNNTLVVLNFEGVVADDFFIEYAVCKHLKNLSKSSLVDNLAFINISDKEIININSIVNDSNKQWNELEYKGWIQNFKNTTQKDLIPYSI